jgi:hypothetical protein
LEHARSDSQPALSKYHQVKPFFICSSIVRQFLAQYSKKDVDNGCFQASQYPERAECGFGSRSRLVKLQESLTLMQKHYGKGSADREGLNAAIEAFQKRAPLDIPLVLGGKTVRQE